MRTMTLPWYPPAPAAGPASILQLPPDDWALEPKIDGVRVIWLAGHAFSRHGGLLTASKGAARLSQILAGIPHTLDGEWVPETNTYFAFDFPDCPLEYDRRRETLAEILGANTCDDGLSMPTAFEHIYLVASPIAGDFANAYRCFRGHGAEGIVIKRRKALYGNQLRPGIECRDWLKRRFQWD